MALSRSAAIGGARVLLLTFAIWVVLHVLIRTAKAVDFAVERRWGFAAFHGATAVLYVLMIVAAVAVRRALAPIEGES